MVILQAFFSPSSFKNMQELVLKLQNLTQSKTSLAYVMWLKVYFKSLYLEYEIWKA